MFERLFTYSKVLARHQLVPAPSKRARYLKHLTDQGAARDTFLRTASALSQS